jgi:hypothetical protein
MKQAKTLRVKDPSQINVYNLNNVRREASKHLRNKKKEHLKAKSEQLEINSEIKNIKTCIGASVTLRRGTNLKLV